MRRRSKEDGRQIVISLTTKGHRAFASLDQRSQRETGGMLQHLGEAEQARVVAAMDTIERLIDRGEDQRAGLHAAGAPARRHGLGGRRVTATLYAAEYGWSSHIEAITAEIVGGFLKNFDPAREHCWIAEMDGEPVGSVFLVQGDRRGGAAAAPDRRSEGTRARASAAIWSRNASPSRATPVTARSRSGRTAC